MARITDKSIKLSGTIGEVTYRTDKQGGTYVVKKKKKHAIPRTHGTMMAQLPMCNVNALERVLHDDVIDRFEKALTKVGARGLYIGTNLSKRKVFLTTNLRDLKACVLVEHTISIGSLKPIGYSLNHKNELVTDIALSISITNSTTIGTFSMDVLTMNPRFRTGDILSCYYFEQYEQLQGTTMTPYVRVSVKRLILDPYDKTPMGLTQWVNRKGCLALSEPLNASGAAWLHQRPRAKGKTQVSTQEIVCVNPLAEQYTGNEAFMAAVESRGGFSREKRFLEPQKVTHGVDVNPEKSHYVTTFSNNETLGKIHSGSGIYLHGTEAVLSAQAADRARFLFWKDHLGNIVSTQPVFRRIIVSDESFTAFFEEGC